MERLTLLWIFRIADFFISCLVITFVGVTCFWRGVWDVMDVYIFPGENIKSAAISWGIGATITALSNILPPIFSKYLKPERKLLFFIVTRLYSFLNAFGCVNLWRGTMYGTLVGSLH